MVEVQSLTGVHGKTHQLKEFNGLSNESQLSYMISLCGYSW